MTVRLSRPLRLALGLALLSVLFIARPDHAVAQVVFDNLMTTNPEPRVAGRPVVANVTVSAPTAITGITTMSLGATPHNQKFVIYNQTTTTFLYVSAPKAFPADSGPTAKASDPFPAITLLPGNTYLIGATADIATTQYYAMSGTVTQGNVSSLPANGNLNNYAAPWVDCCYSVRAPLRLTSTSPVAVPTMSEWAMILFGLLLVGGAAVVIQRRRPA